MLRSCARLCTNCAGVAFGYSQKYSFRTIVTLGKYTRPFLPNISSSTLNQPPTTNFHIALANAIKVKYEPQPRLPDYDALIASAAHQGLWIETWAILDDMLLCGVKPTTATFNHLLHAQRRKSSTYMWKALENMEQNSILFNMSTYTIIIQRFASDGNLELAVQYLMEASQHDITIQLPAIQTVVVLAAKLEMPRLAIDLAKWFESQTSRRLDHIVWMNCLISCAESPYSEGLRECWLAIKRMNIRPDEGLCTRALDCAARFGLTELAKDIFDTLTNTSKEPHAYHHSALLEAYVRGGHLLEALSKMLQMNKSGLQVTANISSPIVEALAQDVDLFDKAWARTDSLGEKGNPLLGVLLKIFLRAASSLGDIQRITSVYDCFKKSGVFPDVEVYGILLEGCVMGRHRLLGDSLLSDMKAAKIKPDAKIYQSLINLCLTQDIYEDAFFYLEEMKLAGYKPHVRTYENIIRKCASENDSRGSVAFEELQEYGYKARPSIEYLAKRN